MEGREEPRLSVLDLYECRVGLAGHIYRFFGFLGQGESGDFDPHLPKEDAEDTGF